MIRLQRRQLLLNAFIVVLIFMIFYFSIRMAFNNMYDLLPFHYPLQNVKQIVKEIELTGKSEASAINPHPKSIEFLQSSSALCANVNPSNTPLLIVVKSHVGQFDLRLAIRKTWGNITDKTIKLVFMVGYQPYTQLLVQQESTLYHDIVQGSFEDTYDNNIFKTLMAYRWTEDFCNNIQLILFVDDDYFVNVDYLLQEISKGTFENVNTMYGYELFWRTPIRNPSGKWYVTKDDYANSFYPAHLAGGAILVSITLVKKFNIAFDYVKHVYIDDLYLGILAKLLDIELTHDIRFSLYFVPPYKMKNHFCSHGYGKRGHLVRAWKEFYLSIKSGKS